MTKRAIDYIKNRINIRPEIGIVLGSGLGDFANTIKNAIIIPYNEIPGFTESTVKGHSGELIFGTVKNKSIVVMKGRIHFYEGIPISEVVFPIKVICDLGIETLIITNASGGVNKSFKPGDLMLITDHINFNGRNPLIGTNDDTIGPRFLDQTYAYDPKLMNLVRKTANKLEIELREGVYIYFTGPTYETPAEVKMARILGADAVGMSTVPEVIVANHRGKKVIGISCITNMAAGILDQPLNHEEVVETGKLVKDKFVKLIEGIIQEL